MDIKEAIKNRHSVRQYKAQPINGDDKAKLENIISKCNEESGLHIQLVLDDPACFDTFLAHYGKFSNADNYIAIIGKKSISDLEERGGYYGQKIVLEAQMLGLNTCWGAARPVDERSARTETEWRRRHLWKRKMQGRHKIR